MKPTLSIRMAAISSSLKGKGYLFFECFVLFVWATIVCVSYVNLSEQFIPPGGEFFYGQQGNLMWSELKECGLCFLWNGNNDGGFPSFIETHGAPLHPFVSIPILLFGLINGAKMTIFLCFFAAGLAQLWLGYVLKFGKLARIWCAVMAMTGGYLAARLDAGLIALVTSAVSCFLLIPALLQFILHSTRKNTVVLAVIIALVLISGQGYMQIGFALSILPAFLLLGLWRRAQEPFPWRRLIVAGVLGLLLVAFFVVPLVRFLPAIDKDRDELYSSAQPIQYIPLNLLIDDYTFYTTPELGKAPYAYVYMNYIGWIPVLLAVAGVFLAGEENRKIMVSLLAAIALVFLCASALSLRFVDLFLTDKGLLRFPAMVSTLAVPLLLGLAGMALEAIVTRMPLWMSLNVSTKDPEVKMRPFNATIPILAVICLLAVLPAKKVSDHFLKLIWDDRLGKEIIKLVPSDEIAWTAPPQGDMWWIWQVYKNGDRLAWNAKPWRWRENTPPAAEYVLTLDPLDTGVLLAQEDGYYLYHFPENHYAWVDTADGPVPCSGKGKGGSIDVTCSSAEPGILNIAERNADGWVIQVDGRRALPAANTYLALNLPAGDHRITLRFQPWDVPLGVLLSVLGIGFAVWYILSDPSRKAASAT